MIHDVLMNVFAFIGLSFTSTLFGLWVLWKAWKKLEEKQKG